jgi:hypothetical protein
LAFFFVIGIGVAVLIFLDYNLVEACSTLVSCRDSSIGEAGMTVMVDAQKGVEDQAFDDGFSCFKLEKSGYFFGNI